MAELSPMDISPSGEGRNSRRASITARIYYMAASRDFDDLLAQIGQVTDPKDRIDLAIKVLDQRRQRSDLVIRNWTLGVGALVAAVGFAGLVVQGYQFQAKMTAERESNTRLREQDMALRQKEYSVKFYEWQIDVYCDLCSMVGRLAKTEKPSTSDLKRLDELIIGRVWPLGDADVVSATAGLMRVLKLEAGIGNGVAGGALLARLPGEVFPAKSDLVFEVTRACRAALMRAFPDTQIGKLDRNAADRAKN